MKKSLITLTAALVGALFVIGNAFAIPQQNGTMAPTAVKHVKHHHTVKHHAKKHHKHLRHGKKHHKHTSV